MVLRKPDIVKVIGGFAELKKRGKYLWALCPLPGHTEKTPSFKVDEDKQTFFCHGCNRGGDVITFIQIFKDMSFKDALHDLWINDKPYKPDPREIRKKELVKKFTCWCQDYHNKLCFFYRDLQNAKLKAKTLQQVEDLAIYYHQENRWLNNIAILISDDDRTKFDLFKQINGYNF